jgi:hypothetical protein
MNNLLFIVFLLWFKEGGILVIIFLLERIVPVKYRILEVTANELPEEWCCRNTNMVILGAQ